MQEYLQYQEWIKPAWAPPEWTFGVVWPVLYLIIIISFGWVFWKIFIKKEIPRHIAIPFGLNIFFNLLFTPIQFGLNNVTLALIDIWLVLITIIWMIWIIKPYNRNIAWAQIPYLAWVSFATILQFSIFWLN